MGPLVERLIASRDAIKRLDCGDYAIMREAREAMAQAANTLAGQSVNYTGALHALNLARQFVAWAQEAQPNDEAAHVLALVDHALIIGADRAQPFDWSDHEEDIADAISDSMDMDWTSRDGARAVVRYLNSLSPSPAHTQEAA
jgi:hypothetical protein